MRVACLFSIIEVSKVVYLVKQRNLSITQLHYKDQALVVYQMEISFRKVTNPINLMYN